MHRSPATAPFLFANASLVAARLFVGGDLATNDPQLGADQLLELVEHGVSDIVDLRVERSDEEFVRRLIPGMGYHRYGIADAGQQVPGTFFAAVTEKIGSLLAEGSGVFVHCHLGVNRAPSAVLAYLLRGGLDVTSALSQIRSARPNAYMAYAADAIRWNHERAGAPERSATGRSIDLAADLAVDLESLRGWRGQDALSLSQALGGGRRMRPRMSA